VSDLSFAEWPIRRVRCVLGRWRSMLGWIALHYKSF
jgi:hypothetical protein